MCGVCSVCICGVWCVCAHLHLYVHTCVAVSTGAARTWRGVVNSDSWTCVLSREPRAGGLAELTEDGVPGVGPLARDGHSERTSRSAGSQGQPGTHTLSLGRATVQAPGGPGPVPGVFLGQGVQAVPPRSEREPPAQNRGAGPGGRRGRGRGAEVLPESRAANSPAP